MHNTFLRYLLNFSTIFALNEILVYWLGIMIHKAPASTADGIDMGLHVYYSKYQWR